MDFTKAIFLAFGIIIAVGLEETAVVVFLVAFEEEEEEDPAIKTSVA